VQDKVVVIDKDAQDLDIIDYLRKIASPDFNVDGPGVYSLYVNFVYTPSGQNLDLAYYPVFNPQDATPIRSHAVLFNTAGTYSFLDQFDSGMTGTIVVQ
jgi:hypothetical protein